jgi:hypothetical protein
MAREVLQPRFLLQGACDAGRPPANERANSELTTESQTRLSLDPCEKSRLNISSTAIL